MDLTPIVAPLGATTVTEADAPEPTDPAVLAAFTEVLASMVSVSQAATPGAGGGVDEAPGDSAPAGEKSAAASTAPTPTDDSAPAVTTDEAGGAHRLNRPYDTIPATPAVPAARASDRDQADSGSVPTRATPATPAVPPAHAHAELVRRSMTTPSRTGAHHGADPGVTGDVPPALELVTPSDEAAGAPLGSSPTDPPLGDSAELGAPPPPRSATSSHDARPTSASRPPAPDHGMARVDLRAQGLRLEPSLGTPAAERTDGTVGSRVLERALAAQVTERVGRLTRQADGAHEMSMELEPAELGRLELRVRLEAGTVHIQLDAHAHATTDLLRNALPELREALEQAGLNAGMLDIGQHGERPRPPWDSTSDQDRHRAAERARHVDGPTQTLGRTVPTSLPNHRGVAHGVDVLL